MNNLFYKISLICAGLSIYCGESIAQNTINYTNSTTSGGLSGDWVLDIESVNATTLLIGTGSGLCTYNTLTNSWTAAGSAGSIVNSCLYDASTGNTWSGNFNMAIKYTGGSPTNYTQSNGLAGDNCRALALDNQGNTWLGSYGTTSGGLTKYTAGSLTQYYVADGLPTNSISGLAVQGTILWIAAYGGLVKLENGVFTTYSILDGLPSNELRDVYVDGATIWIASSAGISKFDGTTFTNYSTLDGLISNDVYAITADLNGTIWIGTTGGVSRFNGSSWANYTTSTGLSSNDVRDIYCTATDVWIGLGGAGLDRIALLPTIEMAFQQQFITDGSTTTSSTNGTDFGNTLVFSGTSERTFTIYNTGVADLHLNGIEPIALTGSGAANYSVSMLPQTIIYPGDSTTYSILFAPNTTGVSDVTVVIATDDPNLSLFDFALTGNGQDVEIEVQSNQEVVIESGDISPSTTDNTDFGSLDINGGVSTYSFLVRNYGEYPLSLTGSPAISIQGTDAANFMVSVTPATTVPGGGQFTSFNLSFDPISQGVKLAMIAIENNDYNESYYTFYVQGEGTGIAALEETPVNDIHLFPNPATDDVTIYSGTQLQEITLFSIHGTLLSQHSVNATTVHLSLQDYAAGTYFIQLKTTDGISLHRMEKK